MIKYTLARNFASWLSQHIDLPEYPIIIKADCQNVIEVNGKHLPIHSKELWNLLNEKYELPKGIINLKIEMMSVNDVVTMTYTTHLRAKE